MNSLILLALVGLFLGLVGGIVRMRSLRSKTHPQAEIVWKQDPLSAWRYESASMLAMTIRSLGMICFTAVLVFDLVNKSVLDFHTFRVGLFVLGLIGIFFTTYTSGSVIAYHAARQWIRPISYGISRDGLFFGPGRVSWKSYSHYEFGPDDGQISLYSSYSPALRTWVIQPSPESFTRVLARIQENVPATPSMDESNLWTRSPLMLILGMTALVLGALLPAVWGWVQNVSWVWIYALVAFFLVSLLGNRLMTVFDGRGKYPEQKVQAT